MIYPVNFEEKIGFDRIRQLLKENCLFELGVNFVDEMIFKSSLEELNPVLKQVAEFKYILEYNDNFPIDNYIDVTSSLKKSRIDGAFLETEEVFNIKRSLESVKSIINFFKDIDDSIDFTELKKVTRSIKFYPAILAQIDKIINKSGQIRDNASVDLKKIKQDIAQAHLNVNKKLRLILKKAQSEGIADEDANLTLRNGRLVIPLNNSNKRKLEGLIHDESSSGKTVYVEPSDVVELNNRIKELEYSERREIIKILTEFTYFLRPFLDDLREAYNLLGYIDFIRAKAIMAVKYKAIKPLIDESFEFKWYDAIHPLLYLSHKKENKEIVPLNIYLNKKNRLLIISGPNAGGKSVCLKTAGLLQYMMQCGMLVPMSEQSHMGIFKDIFIDIGDEQSLDNDLSTYSSHLLNMKFFLKNSHKGSLILIDEFGTGTEPTIGGVIAEAVLEKLNQIGTYGIITTHYANLKHFASATHGIVNGAMLFDSGKMQPVFKLEIGEPGSSFAIDFARKIGLPEDILNIASAKIGEEYIEFDKHLREISRDKQYWEKKRNEIRIAGKELENILDKYSNELNNIKKQKDIILKQAKEKAEDLLNDSNREIENTIKTIKESQADKDKTKFARKNLEEFKLKITNEYKGQNDLDDEISKDIANTKNKYLKDSLYKNSKENNKTDDFVAGDMVKIIDKEAMGEVLEINGNSLLIAIGNMITTIKKDKVVRISGSTDEKIKKQNASFSNLMNLTERKLKFKPQIDIRGKRANEAIEIVGDFIDEALIVAVKELRILHGKGNGILKQYIREYLNSLNVVKICRDEHVEHGGSGITVVELDY